MMRVSVKAEGNAYVVLIENPEQNYRRICEDFPIDDRGDAIRSAFVEAQDWVAKFKLAGIAAEMVSTEVPLQQEEAPRRERRERPRRKMEDAA